MPGSSVLNAIMSDGTFKPRAISRNPESAASLALLARGIEVVKADLWDKTSIVEALQGSEAVFAVRHMFLSANVSIYLKYLGHQFLGSHHFPWESSRGI